MSPRHPSTAPGNPGENLLVAILRRRPNLPGAACIGRPEPFDAVIEYRHLNAKDHRPPTGPQRAAVAEAAGICRRCPEAACPDRITTTQEKSA